MSDYYKTRAHQIRDEIRKLMRKVPKDAKLRKAIRETIWNVALVGACAERDRTVDILQTLEPATSSNQMKAIAVNQIREVSIKDVWDLPRRSPWQTARGAVVCDDW